MRAAGCESIKWGVESGDPDVLASLNKGTTLEKVREVFAACRQSGHSIPIQLREARPGVRMFIIEDPDGNWVEFVEYA